MANGCHNHNLITCIHLKDEWIEQDKDIGPAFTNHFRLQFEAKRDFHFLVDWSHHFNYNTQIDLIDLEATFSLEEIKKATFDLDAYKAPSPNGFPLAFFQKHRDTIQPYLIRLCLDFFEGNANLEHINWANIVLIPKNISVAEIGDVCPISLINTPPENHL